MNTIKKICILCIIAQTIIGTFCVKAEDTSFVSEVSIPLVYPNIDRGPKRKPSRPKPVIVKGVITIESSGIRAQQKNDEIFTLEYYMDNQLIHSVNRNERSPIPQTALTIDTCAYENGSHELTVNLWGMKHRDSAIGMRTIIIKNEEPS